MTIETWLAELKLERYAGLFAENDIDLDVLQDLTESDLEKLGISLGHRKKLMRAISSLSDTETPEQTVAAANGERVGDPSAPGPAEAERRQLTVMFCDLVGSTGLSRRLDPEDMRSVITSYQGAVSAEVARFGGHVAKFMGDGVIAYFGWPRAHENDSERAIRAGLAAVDAVGALSTPDGSALACRIGVATGLVVVGDLIGEGAAQEEAVVGDTPNLAARLESMAEPGQIVVAPTTRRLVGDLFEVHSLGEKTIRGFDEAMEVWRIVRPRRLESRFDARRSEGYGPLIGRSRELDLLGDLWIKARSSEGQVAMISGEAGIGKSRLTAALRDMVAQEPHIRLRYQCSPFHSDTPLHPIVQQMSVATDIQASDADPVRLEKLEKVLAAATDDVDRIAPLFAAMMSIPTGDRYPPQDLSPQLRKVRTLDAILDQLTGLCRRQPVLLVFEDLHWIDPTSQELLDRVIEVSASLRLLIVLTFRPEFRAPWVGRASVTSIILGRLSDAEGIDLIRRIAGALHLPEVLEQQILVKTDGIPLFVEEFTKNIVESGLPGQVDQDGAPRNTLLNIPETLQESLMARLDRLAPIKEVAQVGACLGREFSYEVISAVTELDDATLGAALDQLAEAELIYARGRAPESTYIFKHALVQDVAYGSLLKSRRVELHARVATTLEAQFPHLVDQESEVIARHFAAAGQARRAIALWMRAAERANIAAANAEAERHIRNALAELDGVTGETQTELKAELLTLLGRILTAKSGYGHPDVVRSYSEARALSNSLGKAEAEFAALLGLSIHSAVTTQLISGVELCNRLLDLAAQKNDPVWVVEANYAAGVTYSWRGDFQLAREHLERGFDFYETDQHQAHLALYGQDGGPVCLCRNAMVLWYMGYPDQAVAWMERALALTEELGHPFSRIYILIWAAWLRVHRREVDEARLWNRRALDYAEEQKFPFWTAMALVQRGWLLSTENKVEEGTQEIDAGIAQLRAHGTEVTQAYSMALLAQIKGARGEVVEAKQLVDAALEKTAASAEGWCKPELLRIRGDLALLDRGEAIEPPESWYLRSLDAARQAEAKSWELRTATSLARLWAEGKDRDRARALLEPVVGWFREGQETADLKDATKTLGLVSGNKESGVSR